MTLADSPVFTVEVLVTGVHANGFGEVGDGRSFAFRIEDSLLRVEIYRAFRTELVPDDSDVVADRTRPITDIDVTDERSIVAAVRDLVADAQPVSTSRLARLLAG
ncbi:hypothetical protein ACWWSA_10760 [Mycobacteroides abscessus subsp. abscessus]